MEKEREKDEQKNSVVQMVSVAMLSSIAYLLMMLDFPFPGLPPFLKIDFSDVPALIAAIIFSPIAGVIVEAIKNILHYGIQEFNGSTSRRSSKLYSGMFIYWSSSILIPKVSHSKKFNDRINARYNYYDSYYECVKLLYYFTSVHLVFKFTSYV